MSFWKVGHRVGVWFHFQLIVPKLCKSKNYISSNSTMRRSVNFFGLMCLDILCRRFCKILVVVWREIAWAELLKIGYIQRHGDLALEGSISLESIRAAMLARWCRLFVEAKHNHVHIQVRWGLLHGLPLKDVDFLEMDCRSVELQKYILFKQPFMVTSLRELC